MQQSHIKLLKKIIDKIISIFNKYFFKSDYIASALSNSAIADISDTCHFKPISAFEWGKVIWTVNMSVGVSIFTLHATESFLS